MILTSFPFDGSHPVVRRLLRDPASVRRLVLKATEGMAAEPRCLWRVDDWPGPDPTLMLLTPGEPPGLPVPLRAPIERIDYLNHLDGLGLAAGQWWGFRLTGNPVRSQGQGGAGRGKIKAHADPEHRAWWVDDKGERHGFWSSTVTELWQKYWQFSVPGAPRPHEIQMTAYTGTLKVTDPELLCEALLSGIGRAKAYGCGLLTLHPKPSATP